MKKKHCDSEKRIKRDAYIEVQTTFAKLNDSFEHDLNKYTQNEMRIALDILLYGVIEAFKKHRKRKISKTNAMLPNANKFAEELKKLSNEIF